MKNTKELEQKYANYDVSQLKIFLIAVIGDYTSQKTIKLRREQIAKGLHENVLEDYELEMKVILDLIHKQLSNEVNG